MASEAIQASVENFMSYRPLRPSIAQFEENLDDLDRLTPTVQESIEKARTMRLGYNVVFYVAGPVTGVSAEDKDRYSETSELITDHELPGSRMFGYVPHLHGTDPVAHPNVTPNEVRDIDHLWSSIIADGHLNFLKPVAHGNGIEAGWAELLQIPSLYIVPEEDAKISRIVNGLHNKVGMISYNDFYMDGLAQIGDFLGALQERRLGNVSRRS
jgi:hypothetical protein